MILIADGGSTKADWIAINSEKEEMFRVRTVGLNPAVVHGDELLKRVADNLDLQPYYDLVTRLDFYGAGCGTEKPSLLLKGGVMYFILAFTISSSHISGLACLK